MRTQQAVDFGISNNNFDGTIIYAEIYKHINEHAPG